MTAFLLLFVSGVGVFFTTTTTTAPLLQTASAQSSDPNQLRIVWHTARCSNQASCEELADVTNAIVGDADSGHKDTLIFHYGVGQTPQQYQIDAMKSVTGISDARKGFEFFSRPEIQAQMTTAKNAGFRIMSYDLEGRVGEGPSPDAALQDPVGTFNAAKNMLINFNQANGLGSTNSLQLQATPSHSISEDFAAQIAPKVIWYHLQSQPIQGDDTTCAIMEDWVNDRVTEIEGANSALEDEISFQVTLTTHAASGKTAFETAQDCIDVVIPNDVDGVSVWWGGTQYDNGQMEQIYTDTETTYS